MNTDLKQILYPSTGIDSPRFEQPGADINSTWITQPLLFSIEYALARLMISWGLKPGAMIGHSIGEYVAAHLSGVFSLEDALALVVERGQLMQRMPAGAMLSVPLPEDRLLQLLHEHPGISIAALNSTNRSVVSGPLHAIARLEMQLNQQGIIVRPLVTSHAFHSDMMDPILEEFRERVCRTTRTGPTIPFISNVSGTWITREEVLDPAYWVAHLRGTVRFSDGLHELFKKENPVFLEVGPGNTLGTLVKQFSPSASQPGETAFSKRLIVNLLRHPHDNIDDSRYLAEQIGRLWLYGLSPDWEAYYGNSKPHRIPLPTYPFAGDRYSIELGINPGAPGFAGFKGFPGFPGMNTSMFSSMSSYMSSSIPSDDLIREPVHSYEEEKTQQVPGSTVLHEDRTPVNPIEEKIIAIWQEMLGIQAIGTRDDFFESGGDSLLALQLLSRLKNTFGVELNVNTLMQDTTIEALARTISQHSREFRDEFSFVVEIQAGNRISPFFLVHPIGGHVYFYRDLAVALGEDVQVYGIQARGVDGKTPPFSNIPEMALHYLDEVRRVQPQGPYYIGGASFGGMVAFEMAQQLIRQGREVAILFMIDTPGPQYMPQELDDDASILAYLINNNLKGVLVTAEQIRNFSQDQLERFIMDNADFADKRKPDEVMEEMRIIMMLFKANYRAMFEYRPVEYPGRLLFFRALEHRPGTAQEPEKAWLHKASQGINIYDVPGDHITMNVAPNVEVIARILKDECRSLS